MTSSADLLKILTAHPDVASIKAARGMTYVNIRGAYLSGFHGDRTAKILLDGVTLRVVRGRGRTSGIYDVREASLAAAVEAAGGTVEYSRS